jgi:flavin reductase (DIM6/NTAB) family NADH-FMN oxidoreductase RutF
MRSSASATRRARQSINSNGLTADPPRRAKAPLIRACHADLECKLVDAGLVRKYNFFIFEVVKTHAATSPRHMRTLHYLGGGLLFVARS